LHRLAGKPSRFLGVGQGSVKPAKVDPVPRSHHQDLGQQAQASLFAQASDRPGALALTDLVLSAGPSVEFSAPVRGQHDPEIHTLRTHSGRRYGRSYAGMALHRQDSR
jgi:hypothetical protein